MAVRIHQIEYFLPPQTLDNTHLASQFSQWTAQDLEKKLGFEQRHIAAKQQCASDLAFEAASKLFNKKNISPSEIDYLLLCTQSPDYFLPTTACILQSRLGLRTDIGAIDFNLGCSGYVYGLGLAKGLIESGQAKKVLLLTAETYSKFIHDDDATNRPIFGDAASATIVELAETAKTPGRIGEFILGTDGRGAQNLIVEQGAARNGFNCDHTVPKLQMNGPEIFRFTLDAVPALVSQFLAKTSSSLADYDHFIFHQANSFMLEALRKKVAIPPEKFLVSMRHCGNTVSSTIPIVLSDAKHREQIKVGDKILLVGFGVGYSWAACNIVWG